MVVSWIFIYMDILPCLVSGNGPQIFKSIPDTPSTNYNSVREYTDVRVQSEHILIPLLILYLFLLMSEIVKFYFNRIYFQYRTEK